MNEDAQAIIERQRTHGENFAQAARSIQMLNAGKAEFYSPEKWLEIVAKTAKEAFVTGSRAFGTANDPEKFVYADADETEKFVVSDTDIAVLISSRGSVKTAVSSLFAISATEESAYNNGFKITTPHGVLNIVPLHPLDFACWKLTTHHIQRIIAICPEAKERIKNRETKLGIFEALTGIHKMLLPYSGYASSDELQKRITP